MASQYQVYFRGDISDVSKFEIFWAHNDRQLTTVDSVDITVSARSGTVAMLHHADGAQELCDVAPAPTKPTKPAAAAPPTKPVASAQPILSAATMSVKSGRPARFISKDIGSAVKIDDPMLGGITLGKLSMTYEAGWSDKVEVLITSGQYIGAIWTGPSHLVSLDVRKFTQANIGRDVTYTRDDGAEILGRLISIRGTTKHPDVEIISLDGQHRWVSIESRVEFTVTSSKPPLGSKPKCSECNDTGVVDLFIGTSPCSICKP